MTKRQMIDEILERNTTADPGFLARFDNEELDDYLANLRRLQTPRLTGNAEQYEKYFQFNVPARPVQPAPDLSTAPCLPEEENEVDDSFWHLGEDFETDDENLRQRVDRFAEQLIDQMSDGGEEEYDDGETIVYHRSDPATDEPEEQHDEALQNAGARTSHSRDNDSWLF